MFRHNLPFSEVFLPILTVLRDDSKVSTTHGYSMFHQSQHCPHQLQSIWPLTPPHTTHLHPMPIRILLHRSDSIRKCRTSRLKKAITTIAADYGWETGEISVALVSDHEIHEVNLQHLAHDYPTDVISFDFTEGDENLEGEIIASVDTADRIAPEHDWSGDDELLLYVIHGMLHIIGLRDKSSKDIQAMRAAEQHYLGLFGL